jgi:hypothetical protein
MKTLTKQIDVTIRIEEEYCSGGDKLTGCCPFTDYDYDRCILFGEDLFYPQNGISAFMRCPKCIEEFGD